MHLKQIIVSLGTALLLCLNFSVVSYADTVTVTTFEDDGISPAYEIADKCKSHLEVLNGTAYCTSTAKGIDIVSITTTQTLQKYWGLWIWNDVNGASWREQFIGSSTCLSNTKSGLDNGKYRLKSVFTLIDVNGKSETITVYSDEQVVS